MCSLAHGTGDRVGVNTVILLGATSMLGREVARQLELAGMRVLRAGRGADNEIVSDLASTALPKFSYPSRADVLIHCAAAFGDDSEEGITKNLQVNVAGCTHAIAIANGYGVRKIVYSGSVSSSLLGGEAEKSYGFSKAEAERILGWYAQRAGLQFCSLRLSQLWDTEGRCCIHQPWFGRIVAYASHGQILRMPPAEGPRNFIHVSNAARLLIEAARSDLQGVHDACHPEDIDMLALAKGACEIFDAGGTVEIDPGKVSFRRIGFPHGYDIFTKLNMRAPLALPQALTIIRDAGTASLFGPMDVQ